MPHSNSTTTTTNSTFVCFINGKKIIDNSINPEWTLLTYLRNKLHLTGTKLGCGEGGCGACTVMVSKYDRKDDKIIHFAVNACLTPICSCYGLSVTTIEGIGSVEKGLHPAQERLGKSHGSQCGFCTPGIIMSMYTLLRNKEVPKMDEIETAFQGNLCRCTGYRPILEGYKTFTNEQNGSSSNGCCMNNGETMSSLADGAEGCCKVKANGGGCCQVQAANSSSSGGYCKPAGCPTGSKNAEIGDNCCKSTIRKQCSTLFDPSEFKEYDPSKEPAFPVELKEANYDQDNLVFIGEHLKWFRPVTLDNLLELKESYPDAKLVVGNTEIGIEVKFKSCNYPIIITPIQIPELTSIEHESTGLRIGAAVTLTNLESLCLDQIKAQPKHKTRLLNSIVEMLRWFAGKQIRNTACIGGNIITGSPISDLNPIFMAGGCQLELVSKSGGARAVPFDHTFFTGYRRNVLKPNEILKSIFIPYMKEDEYFTGFKQAKRRDDDIAIVNAGMRVEFNSGTNIIKSISLAFGGMAPTTVLAKTTSTKLVGQKWDEGIVDLASKYLIDDLPLDASAPGGMILFRRSLTLSFFYKFYLITSSSLSKHPLPPTIKSATQIYHKPPIKSAQLYQVVPAEQPDYDLVGRPIVHVSGLKQSTGEAIYIDDMPKFENELYLSLVTSSKAHAKILSINAEEALKLDGVVDFISAKDLRPEHNMAGPIIHDEEIFASTKVTCVGHVIGAVVAANQSIAQRASKLVKIEYEELQPVIITIQDAIKHKSYYCEREIRHGKDIGLALREADHVLEGEMHLGGQEHFYLETHATIAVPREGEMEIFCSTQHPSEIQLLSAHALGVAMNKVVCRTKRMGGGFGGKETRAAVLALPVVVAAKKTNQPVRCMLDRDEDMTISGTRHPFYCKWKAGFMKNGRLHALQLDIYNNAGNSSDLSGSVLERAIFSADNAYLIPNVQFHGYCCKTNLSSNTAFRGFGGPQGMLFCENVMDHIGDYLGIDHAQVRALNLYSTTTPPQTTHFNQPLEHCTIRRCWEECYESSSYLAKKEAVAQFNLENKFRKQGISMIPTKFGIAFTALFLNQAGALVLVYRDGSVLLNHGGTEMGQGLHTKMIQIASRVLHLSVDKIHVIETATDKVPNTSATAASAGSDLNGMAVKEACETIFSRLEPYRLKNPGGKWEDWVNAAYFDRVCLSATGFYKTPGLGFDWTTCSGNPFNYFCYGAACSVVEIDVLTGDHEVKSTDIVMDVGESINPAIDIGQIEGAFTQGYGLYTIEELHYSPTGSLLTKGPGMYKLPGFGDIPNEFNVTLLRGSPNKKAVFSSKAIGEPPLFLAASVFFGLKDAIKSARVENGLLKNEPFRLDSPATAERIRVACEDQFTKKFPQPKEGTFKPWAVRP